VHLIEFRGSHPPSRRIAMLWRKSSAMTDFLERLADVFKQLPASLLDAHSSASAPVAAKRPQEEAGHSRRQSA
jgi:LysR family hydrogen peroxide-inducible transcriptional activator